MKKKVVKQQNISSFIFLGGIVLITLFLVIFTFFMVGKPFVVNSYSNMTHVTSEDYLSKKTNSKKEYYIYIYNEGNPRDDLLKNRVFEYANHARTTKDAAPIYAINAQDPDNLDLLKTLSYGTDINKDVPALVLVKNNAVSTKYNTYTRIMDQLIKLLT